MDDINEKISAVLSDPATLAKITEMAKGLQGDGGLPPLAPALGAESDKVRLLKALRPMLGTEKQKAIDNMITILGMMSVAEKFFPKGE